MALALRLADAFAAHRTAGGPTIPAPGRLTPSGIQPGPRQLSWLFFGLRYDPDARFPSWRRFLSYGPRRIRGPLSVARGAAEHAEVQPVVGMIVVIGGANARHSAASQPCVAARCRT